MRLHGTAPSSDPCRRAPVRPDTHRPVILSGSTAQALEVGRTRLLVVGVVFAVAFMVIGARLVDLSVLGGAPVPHLAGLTETPRLATDRADIIDRNGAILATSLPTAALYADPHLIRDPHAAAAALARVLPDQSQSEIADRLSSDRGFVWIKRNLTPREQYEVNRLGIPGLDFRRELRRVYPHGELTAHVVGFTNVDNVGLAGIERSFDDTLRTKRAPLALSLDLRVQHVLTQELAAAMDEFSAIGAAGLVLDVNTGETLAMVSLPSYNPNDPGDASNAERFNRASLGTYEMGSVFKIFTSAQALDSGVVTVNDSFDTTKPLRVARYTITDFKPENRWLSVPEIFMYSSNIGTARMAMEIGTPAQQAFLGKLGLTTPSTIELGEVGQPIVPSPWRDINTLTISYGHGLAVSPLQVASAVSAIVDGGELRPTTLLKRDAVDVAKGRRVISAATSRTMRDMMRLVVLHGTGRKANAEGYLVGGKTGTSDKLVNGRYARNLRISSFVAAFPMNNPRYVVLAMLDEPKGTKKTFNYATGGWVAAPVVRRVVEQIGPLLGIAPVDEDVENDQSERLLVHANANARTAKVHKVGLQRIAAN